MSKKNEEATTTPEDSKEVAVVADTETAVATVPFDDGLGEIGADDLIIPRLIVSQSQHNLAAELTGKLYCDVTGDAKDKMRMVIIKLTKSRVLFPEKYKKDNGPLCRSHNFTTPAGDIDGATPMADNCADCAYSQWGKDNTPPQCQECWNMLTVDLDAYMPMWFTVKSKALKPTRKIVSALKMRTTAKRVPVWALSFDVQVEVSPGDSGDAFVPVFSGLAELSEDDRENMQIIHDQLVNEDIKDIPSETPEEEQSKPDKF